MPVNPLTQQALDVFKAGRVISVISAPTRRLADARGLILLSQLVYWTVKDRRILETGGWFSKSHQDWMRETCLSRHCLASSLKLLQEAGLVKVWQRMSRTAPWYKLNLNRLNALCQGSEDEILLARFVVDTPWRESILGRPLPYYTRLAQAVDDALLGLFLSRCVYWQDSLEQRGRLTAKKPVWGWSSNDWFNDIGITRTQLRNLLKQAEKLGFIRVTTEGRPFPGISVDFGIMIEAINVPDNKEGAGQTESSSVVRKCFVRTADGAFPDRTAEDGEETLEPLLIGAGQAELSSGVSICPVRSVDRTFPDIATESAYTGCSVRTADKAFRAQGSEDSEATIETLVVGAGQAELNGIVSKCSVRTADGAFRDITAEDGEDTLEPLLIGTDRAELNSVVLKCSVRTADEAFQDKTAEDSEIQACGFVHPSHGFDQLGHGFTQPERGFDQSTRARGFDYWDYQDYTTTTPTSPHCGNEGVVVDVQQEEKADAPPLVFPSIFCSGSAYPIEPLQQIIALALPHRRQLLLDELDGAIGKGVPRNPYSYLRALVARDKASSGGLILEHAHTSCRRREIAAALAAADRQRSMQWHQAAASSAPIETVPLPEAPRSPRRVDDLWAAIGKTPPVTVKTTHPKGENL